ncbi:MAG: PA14 domain-containing protein [Alistipes finegoldii]
MILIPERGVWEFMTKSDDGSVLTIGDRKVVDNDGSHASVMATGRVALEAGLHPIRCSISRITRGRISCGAGSARSGGLRSDTRSEPAHDGFQGN